VRGIRIDGKRGEHFAGRKIDGYDGIVVDRGGIDPLLVGGKDEELGDVGWETDLVDYFFLNGVEDENLAGLGGKINELRRVVGWRRGRSGGGDTCCTGQQSSEQKRKQKSQR
jgi:hypothetical protein